MLLAGLTVKYRDFRFALPFLIQVWMFATPVIYPASLVPAKWRWVLALNPLTGIIEGFRAALFARTFDWGYLAYSAGFMSSEAIWRPKMPTTSIGTATGWPNQPHRRL